MSGYRAVHRVTDWLCGGAIVFIAVSVLPGVESDAEARARTTMICEEWRDYQYSVETGEFLEWVGDPYEVCYIADEPISRPDKPPGPNYGGGWGIPIDPQEQKCKECRAAHDACNKSVTRGGQRCIAHYRQQAYDWCVRHKRKNRGLPLEGEYRCFTLEGPNGKPVVECSGPAIDDCVNSFAQDQPGQSIADTFKVNIGFDWWGVGADHESTVTWGGSRGYLMGCWYAQQEASGVCLANSITCAEAAGGCQ